MSEVFEFHRGTTPLLISMPHSGIQVPEPVFRRLSDRAKTLADTDWHVPRLYEFVRDLGASTLTANFSRYVVDLNRPPDNQTLYPGQANTALCPVTSFDGTPLYVEGQELTENETQERRHRYWQPYHDKLAEELTQIKKTHGCVLLYDAHSITSRVPRLFEGRLPDLNLGTARGASCAPAIEVAIAEVLAASDFSSVVNGRFVGGYITRHYGRPDEDVHAVQMEIAQCGYMEEIGGAPFNEAKADKLRPVLGQVLTRLVESSREGMRV